MTLIYPNIDVLMLVSESVLKRINDTRWCTKFELLPGIMTTGWLPVDAKSFVNNLKIEKDFSEKKILDIGTLDGAIAYEFERRGGKTYAMDIQDPNETGFNVAKEILNSNVEYRRDTVYNLSKIYEKEFFDIVVFKGVYYHLKHPLLALEAIWDVLKQNGTMVIAGEVLLSYAETLDGKVVDLKTVKQIANSEIPLTVCYPGHSNDTKSTIWFVPNLSCIKSWLNASGFELVDFTLFNDSKAERRPTQRFVGTTKKMDNRIIEHPIH